MSTVPTGFCVRAKPGPATAAWLNVQLALVPLMTSRVTVLEAPTAVGEAMIPGFEFGPTGTGEPAAVLYSKLKLWAWTADASPKTSTSANKREKQRG